MSWAVITGGSKGIGFEIAKSLAEQSYHIFLIARHEKKKKKAAETIAGSYGIQARYKAVDLTQMEQIDALWDEITSEKLQVSVWVNNAGGGKSGLLKEMKSEDIAFQVQLNVTALMVLSQRYIAYAARQRSGALLNVASIAAFVPGPFMSVYFATKAAVLQFTLALRAECTNSGIDVSVLCPGHTPTDFQSSAGQQSHKGLQPHTSAAFVAREAVDGLLASKAMIIPGKANKCMVFVQKFIPGFLIAKIITGLNKAKQKAKKLDEQTTPE